MDIPSSPAAHLYSTPPTSKKPFRGFRGRVGMCRERGGGNDEVEEEEEFYDFGTFAGSPPPLSTFYDGPLDGSLTLSLEDEREEEEERYASISSYRRDAGFKDSAVEGRSGSGVLGSQGSLGFGGGLHGSGGSGGSIGGTSKKRTWASTLDEDEWYENGRGGLIKSGADGGGTRGGGTAQGGEQAGRGQGGGGKRRIIDVVGSVASKLWEAVKGNASWGLYYPSLIVKGVGGGSSGSGEKRGTEKELQVKQIGEGGAGGLQQGLDNYTSGGSMINNHSTTSLNNRTSLEQPPRQHLHHQASHQSLRPSSASSRRSTLSTAVPDSPTKIGRRRSGSTFSRSSNTTTNRHKARSMTTTAPPLINLQDVDKESGLQASWVLVPQQEFAPTVTAPGSNPSPANTHQSTCTRPSSSRSHISHASAPRVPSSTHGRSASAASLGLGLGLGKKRPFRYPVAGKTSNVVFEFGNNTPGSGGGAGGFRRGRKKSLSMGGVGVGGKWGLGAEEEVFGVGGGQEEEDEVDESMRRWNERLRDMIREGKEALGSKVEVLYED